MTDLWQLQPAEHAPLTIDDVRRLAARTKDAVERRTRWGLAIAAAEIFAFGGMFLASQNPIQRAGCAMTLAGLLYMSGQLLRRKSSAPPQALALTACVQFEAQELARQRDFHQGWWFWSRLVLFVPGPVLYAAGYARAFPGQTLVTGVVAGIFISIAAWAVPLNLRLARGYQRRIDALRALQHD